MRRHRGSTLIDVLVASLLIGGCIGAVLHTWFFRGQLVSRSQREGVALNLVRRTMEETRQLGFDNVPEFPSDSPSVTYYNSDMVAVDATSSDAQYQLTMTVISDRWTSADPPDVADDALRAVRMLVVFVPTGETICDVSSNLVYEGV